MNALEYLGLGFFGLLIAVTLMLTRRVYLGVLLWSWAWLIQILTGIAISAPPIAEVTAVLLASLFPLLQLAGLYIFLLLPIPLWLVILGIALILLKVSLSFLGLVTASALISTLAEIPLLGFCAYLSFTRIDENWIRAGLGLGYAALVAIEIFDAVQEALSGTGYFEWWLWLAVCVPMAATQLVAWIERSRNLMEKAEIESAAKRAAEDRFDALASKSKDVIVELGTDGRITYVSPNVERNLGFTVESLKGTKAIEFVEKLKPETDMHDRMPNFSTDLRTMVTGGPFGRNYRVRHPDGDERWVEVTASRFYTREGALRVIAVIRDISARRRLELEGMKNQKLDSLGMLAAGVAHDFNNLLVNVLGNAELAASELELGETGNVRRRLKSLEESALQAKTLTQQLLIYAGKGTMEPSVIDIATELTKLKDLLKTTLGDTFTLEFDLADSLQPVEIEVAQLQQILLNLITNARDACEEGGNVTVELSAAEQLPADAVVPGESRGPYVCISVRDNGAGMSPDNVRLIFDPFYTTKFDGRGLGLAAIFGILRMLNGAIEVRSAVGEGSSFRVYLPTTSRPLDTLQEVTQVRSTEPSSSQLPILTIDDSELPRQLVKDAMATIGREVVTAEGGEAALELLASGVEVETILMDLAMPGLSGAKLIARLREIIPDVKIIIMSGYNATVAAEKLGSTDISAFLQKPFRLKQLHEVINAVESAVDNQG